MLKRLWPILILTVVALCLTSGCASISQKQRTRTFGLDYRLIKLRKPRPARAHILKADLARGQLRAEVVLAPDPDGKGPAEAALTDPFELVADDPSVLAFVNANPWDSFPDERGRRDRSWFKGQAVDIIGMAVSAGEMRSSVHPRFNSVWTDVKGKVMMGTYPPVGLVWDGLAGFDQIVKDGEVVVWPGGHHHPRTALGINKTGDVLWLVVVDGRQKDYSEGMSLHELATFMRDLGCWNVTNMDGGGSSVMGLAEQGQGLRIMNSPSDQRFGIRRVRPLPVILTIRKKPDR